MPADQSPAQTENCPSAPGAPGAPGAYDIRIARDGTWFHEGAPIGRKPLVKLFASVLWRDDGGGYWLRTPAARGRIEVGDAPFTAVELAVRGEGVGQGLPFSPNPSDWGEAAGAPSLPGAGGPAGGSN